MADGRVPTIELEAVLDRQRFNAVRGWTVALCFLVMFFDGYDLNLLGYVGPALIAHFGITKAQFGPLVSAGLAGFMLGAVALGDLGDRFGRKRMIVGGCALFGVLTLAATWTDSVGVFVVLRFLAGLGLGGAVPNAIALNAEFSPSRARATAIGVMFVGYTLGGAAPGWTAAALLADSGWRSVFYVGAGFPLLMTVAMTIALPESVRFLAARSRLAELQVVMRRLTGSADPLPEHFEVVSSEVHRVGSPSVQLFVDGRALPTALLWLAFVSCLTSILFVIAWTPTLVAGRGIGGGRAALIGAMWQTGGAFGSLAITRCLDRFGIPSIAVATMIAALLVVSIGQVVASQTALAIVVLVGGFFGSGGQVGLNAVAGTIYPTMIRATGVGWAFGVGRVGAILGPLVGGALVAGGLGIPMLYAVMALPFVVTAIAMMFLHVGRRRVT